MALDYALRQPGLVSIPKAGDTAHMRENAAVGALRLMEGDLAEIDAAFPAPKRKRALEML